MDNNKLYLKITYIVYLILFISAIYNCIFQGGDKLIRIGIVLALVLLLQFIFKVTLLNRYKKIYLPTLGFIFIATYLARVVHLYRFTWYDKFLHFSSGLLLAYVGLILYDYFYNEKNNIKGRILFSILLAVAIAGLWEVWEFSCDSLFNMTLQKTAKDTMYDIICGTSGGILINIVFYIKNRKVN